jgi:hypothetical protein
MQLNLKLWLNGIKGMGTKKNAQQETRSEQDILQLLADKIYQLHSYQMILELTFLPYSGQMLCKMRLLMAILMQTFLPYSCQMLCKMRGLVVVLKLTFLPYSCRLRCKMRGLVAVSKLEMERHQLKSIKKSEQEVAEILLAAGICHHTEVIAAVTTVMATPV